MCLKKGENLSVSVGLDTFKIKVKFGLFYILKKSISAWTQWDFLT